MFREIGTTRLSASLGPTRYSDSGLYRLTLVSQVPCFSRSRLFNLEGHRKRRCGKPGRRFRWSFSLPCYRLGLELTSVGQPGNDSLTFPTPQSANGGATPGSIGNPRRTCFLVLHNGCTHDPKPWRPLRRYPPDGDDYRVKKRKPRLPESST